MSKTMKRELSQAEEPLAKRTCVAAEPEPEPEPKRVLTKTETGYSFDTKELAVVTIGTDVACKDGGVLSIFTSGGDLTQRFPVDGSLLFAHAVTPVENYVYCADGMTLLRYDVMTGKKETIVFNAEYFYPVNAGVPCGPDGGFVVRCGESDLAYFASNGTPHPGISQDVAATFSCYLPIDDFAASEEHVFTICSQLLYVYNLKFEQVGEYISNTEIGFQPKFIAVNGEGIVLVTNGTKGAWCDYKAGQEPVFHRVEFPFDVTGLSPFATERFSCHTKDGFQVVDMEWLEELATCDE